MNKSENRLLARAPKFKCKEVKHLLMTENVQSHGLFSGAIYTPLLRFRL